MKKILFLTPSTGLGGAERQAILLAKSLSTEHDVSFLCMHFSKTDYQVPDKLNGSNVSVYIIESCYPKNYWSRLIRTCQLCKFFLGHRFDSILAYQYEMNVTLGLLDYLFHFKRIIWNQRDEGLGTVSTFINKLSVKRYNHFIANSVGGADYLKRKLSIDKKRISIIPNGIDIKSSLPKDVWRLQNGYKKNEVLACMVANIQSNKDHITLIEAWEKIVSKGIQAKLLLVGYYGNTYEKCLNLIREKHLENYIVFTGPCNDVGSLLNAMDMSILSSPSEGLSNTMLETMAIGIPFIGSKIPSIESLLGENYPYLFPVGNANTLASLIEEILNNKEKAQLISDNNKLLVESNFSVNKLKERTKKIIFDEPNKI